MNTPEMVEVKLVSGPPGLPDERIVAAAIAKPQRPYAVPGHYYGRFDLVVSIPAPARHHHCLYLLNAQGIDTASWAQGFLTSAGRFVDRHEAWAIAEAANQIRQQTGPHGTLFSEDLW